MLPTQYASFMKRWIAHIIDVMIAGFLGGIILIPLVVLTAGAGVIDKFWNHGMHFNMLSEPHAFLGHMFTPWVWPFSGLPIALGLMWFMSYTVLYWLYFAVFESSPRQATPGKMMFGLFVADELGRRITFPRALGRTVAKVLSGMFCWLGYLLALFTARKQALHDLLASTLVLEPAYPAPYANVAPPQATPPAAPFPPSQAAPPAGPAPPAPSAPPAAETSPPPAAGEEIEKPADDPAGEDKPEQEKE